MNHPILQGKGRIIYITTWMVLCTIQVFVLYYLYETPVSLAVWDALLYNGLFFGIGIGYWYIVRYANPDKSDTMQLVFVHFFTAFITIAGWTWAGVGLLQLILKEETEYLRLVKEILPWRFVVGLFYYAVLILIYYLARYLHEIKEQASQQQELQTILKATELRALKSQINPHFIFNSLNSISSLTISAPEKAQEMVIKLSDFLRYSLTQDDLQENTLAEEIGQIERYLEIEKVRFGDKLIFKNELNESDLALKVPKLILQPIFENAIKYGVYESLEPVTITIEGQYYEGFLSLKISNNFDPEAIASKGEGIGLSNIKQRLEIRYGITGLLHFENKGSIFTVQMKIPQTKG